MDPNVKKRAKIAFSNILNLKPHEVNIDMKLFRPKDCVVSCNPAPANVNIPILEGWKAKDCSPKENTMRIDDNGYLICDSSCGYSKSKTVNATGIIVQENNETETQRKFLTNRLYDLRNDKYRDLRVFFGFEDMPYPSTAAEMVKRIQDGMYVLPEKGKDYGTDTIRWRDPKKTEDHDGYAAADAAVTTAHTKVKEDIAILSPEKGLESVRAFADTTFH